VGEASPGGGPFSTTTDNEGATWSSGDDLVMPQLPSGDSYSGSTQFMWVACGASSDCVATGFYGSSTSSNFGQTWVGYQPLSSCVYPASATLPCASLGSLDTFSGATSPYPLDPTTVAGQGVLITIDEELSSGATTASEGVTTTVPLTFTATA